ncbi:MAG: four-carbon acid sugar kinase family protein, partial [Bauldia sp.]
MTTILGCIADDFTGASDLANTLNKGGMVTVQYVGVPSRERPADCEAAVVALKTRSIPAAEAVAESLAALAWLKRQGCRQFLFKYCSTFDSTPEGNIGPVAEALLDALDAPVAVVCPVFPATGRTLFMGHLFVKDRLLSESGMEKHPLTSMTDPDIRRWLRLQTRGEVGLVSYAVVRQGAAAIRAALDGEAAAGRRLVVVDAVVDDDLIGIGAAVAEHRLVTGGSGIAIGLPENFRKMGLLGGDEAGFSPARGPGAVLSGSCSIASRGQVAAYLADHPGLAVDPE